MRIDYEDLKRANEAIVTTKIEKTNKRTGEVSSKDYAEVNQRIKAFRMVYPDGSITTEMLSNEGGVCIFRAYVYGRGEDDQFHQFLLGTGTAYEKEGSTFINQNSYIENCETSAVGRALGMAGFGIDTSVASYEEVKNAMANQGEEKKPTPAAEQKTTAPKVDPKEKKSQPEAAHVIKATPNQVAILKSVYKGKNMEKLLNSNGISSVEEISMEKASEIISKLEQRQKERESK